MDKLNLLDTEILELCNNIYEELGAGLREKVYQNALNIDLLFKYKTILEYPISINYKGACMSICYPDILLNYNETPIILEIKCISKLSLKEHLQLRGYIHHSPINDGYLINFGLRELEIVRYNGEDEKNLTDEDY